jgi:hypothetical protein
MILWLDLAHARPGKGLQFVCAQARALLEPKADAFVQAPDDGALMASYSVFVVEPGSLPGINPSFYLSDALE